MVAHLAKRTQYHSELVSGFNWLTQEGSTKPFSLREYILLIMTYISNKAAHGTSATVEELRFGPNGLA